MQESTLSRILFSVLLIPAQHCQLKCFRRQRNGSGRAPWLLNLLFLFLVTTWGCSGASPSITAVTNAAIPDIDLGHGKFPVYLSPRSIATIFGSNLASATASASPPWNSMLGGVEVHLVTGPAFPCAGCDYVADLIFVSPTQINFLIPDAPIGASRIVLVRDGVPFDLFGCNYYGCPPGAVDINTSFYDQAVFQVGYECLFSFSLTDPSTCGVSWQPGDKRAPLGAVTDLSGRLITSQNPVHQGQTVTLWLTGLPGLTKNTATGLFELKKGFVAYFGIAQYGKDVCCVFAGFGWGQSYGEIGMWGAGSLWAGESPQFEGFDQVNIRFPTCSSTTKAAGEERFDVFMTFTGAETYSGGPTREYLPFLISAGEPNCSELWVRFPIH